MGGFRRFIINTAEMMMIILVVILTLVFAVSFSGSMGMMGGGGLGVIGFLIGGAVGFIVASVVAAYFFLLSEIAENTKRIR